MLRATNVWGPAGSLTLYRWIPATATYGVIAPWPGNGRFDCGSATLYLCHSPEGAMAEYFRRHPELLAYQHRFKARLFRISFTGIHDGLDVSSEANALLVGIAWDRLRSSDLRRPKRHQECQALATEVVNDGGVTISYPSAAYENVTSVVTFGDGGLPHWTLDSEVEITHPHVDPAQVRVLPVGADP